MKYIIISCSLNPKSRSRILAEAARDRMKASGHDIDYIDLADFPLPHCDGAMAYGDPNAQDLKKRMEAADGILMAVPIYNYDVNSSCKNVVELTGRDVWTNKVAGFMCAAGGQGSYMSVMAMANSLMLDFRTYIVPRFVYTNAPHFDEGKIIDEEVDRRVDELLEEFTRVTAAIRG